MFALQTPTPRGVGGRPGRGLSPRPAEREGPTAARRVAVLRRTVTGFAPLVGAIALILLGGLFAAIDAAISTVSSARVEEMVRDERPGAVRLLRVVDERPRYINLVVLLRITCETAATVLLGGLPVRGSRPALGACRGRGHHGGGQLRGDGRRAAHARPPERLHHRLGGRASPAGDLGVCWPRSADCWSLVGNALTPGRGFRNGPFASEIELREVVDLAQQRGVVADDERRMIQSVFELGDTSAREVMVPRTEMVWIERTRLRGRRPRWPCAVDTPAFR